MRPPPFGGRARGTAAGLVLAQVVPEIADRAHPVAGFGTVMGRVEEALWADDRNAGVRYAAVGAAIGAVGGRLLGSTATAVCVTTAGRQLRTVATTIGDRLAIGDLEAARATLPSLVGRDPSTLDSSGMAAAVVESLAENMVDAVYAPALWAVLGGAGGTGMYRAINTMDAMVGHRSERYEHFGWAAARADDVANLVPARIFALAVLALAPADRRAGVVRAVRQDASAHPSPNAGVAEAAVAGALGVSLGGPLRYGDRLEDRPVLGDGARPQPADVARAVQLAARAELALIGTLGILGLLGSRRRRR